MADCEVIGAVLTADPISEDDAIAAVEGAEAGAVVSFRGVVRNHDGGRPVSWDWARVGQSFHDFRAFGTLEFE